MDRKRLRKIEKDRAKEKGRKKRRIGARSTRPIQDREQYGHIQKSQTRDLSSELDEGMLPFFLDEIVDDWKTLNMEYEDQKEYGTEEWTPDVYGPEELPDDPDGRFVDSDELGWDDFIPEGPSEPQNWGIRPDIEIIEESVSGKKRFIVEVPSSWIISRKRQGYKVLTKGMAAWDLKIRNLRYIGDRILHLNREVFESEDIKTEKLKHLTEKEIAEELKVSPNWISSIKLRGYIKVPRLGILPLSLFFKRAGVDIEWSESKISEKIWEVIKKEDPRSPFKVSLISALLPPELRSADQRKLRRKMEKYGIPNRADRKKIFDICKEIVGLKNSLSGEDLAISFFKNKDAINRNLIKYRRFIDTRISAIFNEIKGGKVNL